MEIDITSKCRICLNEDEQMHYLFDEFDEGMTLLDIFTTTTNFDVDKNDGLSHHLCRNCVATLVEFYNLKIIYKENESQIKTILEQVNQINESLDDAKEDEVCITIKVEKDEKEAAINANYQTVETYSCPECDQYFLDQTDFEQHLKIEHNIELSNLPPVKVKFLEDHKCKICNEIFTTEEDYNEHYETHKKNICDICGIGFLKKSYLRDHKETHFPEKRHVCSFCNKAFQRRTVLVKHRRIHTNPRECICEICGQAFNEKGTLKTHIMLIHVKARNFTCNICGIKFPLKSTLEKHEKRHGHKERLFICSQCPLGYKDKSSLDRHIFVKHSGKNKRATCEMCGKQYAIMSSLLKHYRACHNGLKQDKEQLLS